MRKQERERKREREKSQGFIIRERMGKNGATVRQEDLLVLFSSAGTRGYIMMCRRKERVRA